MTTAFFACCFLFFVLMGCVIRYERDMNKGNIMIVRGKEIRY